MNIFLTTQMRTGSTWLVELISGLFGAQWDFWEKGRYIEASRFKEQIKNGSDGGWNVIKMHYTHPKTICDCIPKGDKKNFVINITRDIMDVAVSKILYMRYDTPLRSLERLQSINDMRHNFGNKTLGDKRYINLFIKSPNFNHIVKNWLMYNDGYNHPNYYQVSYELLHRRRLFVMREICNFIGIERDHKALRQVIVSNNFASKSGRPNGKGINSSFRRKGIIGDHENYINQRNRDYIRRLVAEGMVKWKK